MAETCGVHKIGETVVPPAGLPMLQDFGLMVVNDSDGVGRPCLIKRIDPDNLAQFCEERIGLARASESIDGEDRVAADDIRTMSVKYTANGERFRNFRESVGEMTNTEMPDFPYEPRTCLSYLQAVQSVSENCYAQHLAWLQQSKIPEGSRAAYEDETLAHILDVAISFDCLCVTNLAAFELLVRRRQLIAEAHAYNPSSPSYEGSEYWMGNRFKHGGAIVVPALTEHVAKKLQADFQIMKERRKLEALEALVLQGQFLQVQRLPTLTTSCSMLGLEMGGLEGDVLASHEPTQVLALSWGCGCFCSTWAVFFATLCGTFHLRGCSFVYACSTGLHAWVAPAVMAAEEASISAATRSCRHVRMASWVSSALVMMGRRSKPL